MASDDAVNQSNVEKSNEYETPSTDRSLLDFMKKDDADESKVITTEFDDKLHVSEPEPKFEECKVEEGEEEKVTKPSLLQKLHRSGSNSSSSSEEEVEEDGVVKKKKKGLKETIAEKLHKEEDTPVQVVTQPEEKKGLLEKIKDKLPGGDKKAEQETIAPPTPVEYDTGEPAKKGLMEKIKEKLPGGGPKVEQEQETVAPTTLDHYPTPEGSTDEPAKKGIMDKIKEKLPGHHTKTTSEEDNKQNESA